jgi:Outer membrane lipoprotein-sorting protein
MKIKLLFTLLLMIPAAHSYSQSGEEVVAKYLLKTGGIDKWKSLQSRKTVLTLVTQGVELPLTMYEKPLAMKRMEIKVPGVVIIQTYNGKESWMLNPQMGKDPVKLTDEQSKDFAEGGFEDDFIDFKKKGYEVTLLGTEEVDGIKCFKIQRTNKKENTKTLHFFDAETYLLVLEISYKTMDQKTIESKSYTGDYHDVDGLMFPFFEETKIGDQTVEKSTIQKIILNEPMDDSLFTLAKQ